MHSTSALNKSNFDRPVSAHDKQPAYTSEREHGKNKDDSSQNQLNAERDDLEENLNPGKR
jgi:hypothetical protein